MSSPIHILSGSDVSILTASLSAQDLVRYLPATTQTLLCLNSSEFNATMISVLGRAMYAINHAVEPSDGSIQNPARIATSTPQHKILYMPSRLATSSNSTTSIKIVSVPTETASAEVKARGLPATTLLIDEESGAIKAVINASELTGLRTAAVSALATTILADPKSRVLAIFGSGTQAFYHARLILELFPNIHTLAIIGRSNNERTKDLMARLKKLYPSEARKLYIHFLSERKEVEVFLPAADIICTCVPSFEPLFTREDLKPTVHINAIGSYTPKMHDFPGTLLDLSKPNSISTILTDHTPSCLSESGELISADISPHRCLELGALLDSEGIPITGAEGEMKRKELRSGGMSLFKCVGVGGMDSAIGEFIYEKAVQMGVGIMVDF